MGELDLFDPETYLTYFGRYFADVKPDANGVNLHRAARDFREVETRFRMIDDQGREAVVVPFGDAASRIDAYRAAPGPRTLRALQPFVVDVPTREVQFLDSLIETIHDQVRRLRPGPQYDRRFGLIVDEIVPFLPSDLISP
jgi:hypothetical protein